MKNKMIVGIMGVRGGGKDHVGNIMYDYLISKGKTILKTSSAEQLKNEICVDLGINMPTLERLKNTDELITWKDQKLTMREIHFARSKLSKKINGDNYYTRILLEEVLNADVDIVIITDIRLGGLELVKLMEIRTSILVIEDHDNPNHNKEYEHLDELKQLSVGYDLQYSLDNTDKRLTNNDIINMIHIIPMDNGFGI